MNEKIFVLLVIVATLVIAAAVTAVLLRDDGGTDLESGLSHGDHDEETLNTGLLPEAAPVPLESIPEDEEVSSARTLRIESIRPSVPRGSLCGRVLREGGAAVKGARIFLFETQAEAFLRSKSYTGLNTETGSAGDYILEGIPTGRSYLIRCAAETSAAAEAECPPVEAGRIVPVADIVLSDGFTLTGIVTDEDGRPLAGARLEAVNSQDLLAGLPAESAATETRTDAAGRYTMRFLGSEQYEITAETDGHMPATKAILFGFLGSFDRELTLDFTLQKGLHAIRGRVMSAEGKPLPGALVEIHSLDLEDHGRFTRAAAADGGGRFTLEGLSEGRYSVTARAKGHFQKTPAVVTTGEEAAIRLERMGAVEGTIAAVTGSIPDRFSVSVKDHNPRGPRVGPLERFESTFGKGGRFRLDDLPPGTYTLLARAGGFAWTASAPVEVAAGRTTRDVEIVLSRGGSVTGRVRDQYGRPAAGFEVSLMHEHYQPGLHFGLQSGAAAEQDKTALSGEGGSFVLENVAPGNFTIQVAGTGMALKLVRDVRVEEGREQNIGTVTVTAGGTLIGTAYDAAGAPSRGTRVVAMNQKSGICKTAVTDNSGFYRMNALAPGTYTVYLESTSWSGLEFRSDVTAVVNEAATTRADLFVRRARN